MHPYFVKQTADHHCRNYWSPQAGVERWISLRRLVQTTKHLALCFWMIDKTRRIMKGGGRGHSPLVICFYWDSHTTPMHGPRWVFGTLVFCTSMVCDVLPFRSSPDPGWLWISLIVLPVEVSMCACPTRSGPWGANAMRDKHLQNGTCSY